MGKRDDGDAWKRYREREDEEEKQKDTNEKAKDGSIAKRAGSNDELRDLISKADPIIEQVNSLYQMYVSGVERLPPLEKRKLLENMMLTIQNSAKVMPALLFQAQNIQNKFSLYRDRWDKLMRDLEAGVLKRRGK